MISKNTVMAHLKELVNSNLYEQYMITAKTDDYARVNSAPHITLSEPNTSKMYTYVVTLSQDFKSVKVNEEDGIMRHEWGFVSLEDLKPKKKPTTRKATKRTTTRKTEAK